MNHLDKTAFVALQQRLATPARVNVLISAGKLADKEKLFPAIKDLSDRGVNIFATEGTSRFLVEHDIANNRVYRVSEESEPNIKTLFEEDRFHFVVNVLIGNNNYDEQNDFRLIRSESARQWIPWVSEADSAIEMIKSLVSAIDMETFVYHHGDPSRPSDLKSRYHAEVRNNGGIEACHAHWDKGHVISDEKLALGHALMEHKWKLFDDIKAGQAYSHEGLIERMSLIVESMIAQGVRSAISFIDVDPIVKLGPMEAAIEVRDKYRKQIKILYATQPLHGVLNPEARRWYEIGCEMADIIGGLPSKDRPQPEEHLRFIMRIARNMGKPLHVHIDQENNPDEHDTELLARMTMDEGLEGLVWGVHAISLAAQPAHEQDRVIKLIKDAGIGIIICPSAALSMKHPDKMVPSHNSIAPFEKLLSAGVKIRFGPDNIADIFQPFVDGDMWFEMRILMEACRYYDYKILARLACGLDPI